MNRRGLTVLFVLFACVCSMYAGGGPQAQSSAAQPMVAWPYVGADTNSSRYSPLADINRENVGQLKVAWEWLVNEKPMPQYGPGVMPNNFSNTPLMIDNVVYVATMYNRVVALDADTGKELWAYDPQSYQWGQNAQATGFTHRGVSPWWDGDKLYIFLPTRHRLIKLDAKTGKPDPAFGGSGEVDLSKGARWEGIFNRLHLSNQSPVATYKDLVFIGFGLTDRIMHRQDPPGFVRAYNAKTGKEVWSWYVVPQRGSDPGGETWENDSWAVTGHANVWAAMQVDTERGLLYVPTSTPSNDFYGGKRLGANLFAESLLCLDATNGKIKWYFQTVHHGLWDWDLGTTPNLVTINVDGRRIDAVAQVTKTGMTFVFDRVTGKPVWPIEERPVDTTTNVPGEKVWPTQPFPTKPPPFGTQGFTLEDAFDLTPELKAMALTEIRKHRYGPMFTPPSLEGTYQRPTASGGANWGGAAFDPETGMLYVKSSDSVGMATVGKYDRNSPANRNNPYASVVDVEIATASGTGTTFSDGLPISKPPYAHVTGIDLNKGELRWRVPFGVGSDTIRNHPALKDVKLPDRLGTVGPQGVIVTKGGLVFIGGGDPALYAFDKATGKELWSGALPRKTSATPMTYRSRSGRQFVLVATGSGSDAAVAAFALPTTGPASR